VYTEEADSSPPLDSTVSAKQSGWAQCPQAQLESERFRQGLISAIDGLPEREKLVMSLYYEEELNLREIGGFIGVSESRVCQIYGQALIRLRVRLRDWLEAGP
jgi:RNA polymerase sigma factor for flagellar operon FliA